MSWLSKYFPSKPHTSETDELNMPKLSAADYCIQGEKAFDEGKFVEAMEYFQASIELDSRFEKSYLMLSAVYEKQRNVDKSKATLYALLAVEPNNVEALKRINRLNEEIIIPKPQAITATNTSTLTHSTKQNISTKIDSYSKQFNSSHEVNYHIVEVRSGTGFDFFIMYDDGNRIYFKNQKNGLDVVHPSSNNKDCWEGYVRPKDKLIIPKQIVYKGNPLNVKRISSGAFTECKNLRQIVLPDTVEEIGSFAFCSCTFLKSIDLPKSINHIGDYAFMNCENLRKVIIPNGINKIENGMFNGCQKLEMIEIPDSVKEIGNSVFFSQYDESLLCLKMKGLPPICTEKLRWNANKIVVVVPKHLKEKYKIAPYWQLLNIQESVI